MILVWLSIIPFGWRQPLDASFFYIECIESFFGCESSKVPEESRDIFDTLQHSLNNFLFTRRYDDVPEQPPVYESSGTPNYEDLVIKDFDRETWRWKYLIEHWKTDDNNSISNSLRACVLKYIVNIDDFDDRKKTVSNCSSRAFFLSRPVV
jgi:hypothetical protein